MEAERDEEMMDAAGACYTQIDAYRKE